MADDFDNESEYGGEEATPRNQATFPSNIPAGALAGPVQRDMNQPPAPPREPRGAPQDITIGGQPGEGDPSGDTRSRYTARFAGGHQMEVVGGGFGVGPRNLGVGNPMPSTGQVQLSRAEQMRLQGLTNALSTVQQQVSDGTLTAEQGQYLIGVAKKQIAPLQQRADAANEIAIHQQGKRNAQAGAHARGLQNMDDAQVAQNLPNRISKRQLPNGQLVEEYVDNTGKIHPSPAQEQANKKEIEVMKQQAQAADHTLKMQQAQQKHELDLKKHSEDRYTKLYEQARKHLTTIDATTKQEVEPDHEKVVEKADQMEHALIAREGPKAELDHILKRYPQGRGAPEWVDKRMKELLDKQPAQ